MIHSLPDADVLLYSCALPTQRVGIEQIEGASSGGSDSIQWLHVCATNPKTRHWLKESTDIDSVIVDALLADNTRPRLLVRKEGMLLNLRLIQTDREIGPVEDMVSLRVWLSNGYILTSRRLDTSAIEDIQRAISAGIGPVDTGEFVVQLIRLTAADVENVMEDLEERVSQSEFHVTTDHNGTCKDLTPIRRSASRIAHYLSPQKTALQSLVSMRPGWLSDDGRESLVEVLDTTTRHVDALTDVRNRAQLINEEVRNIRAARLNLITYLFSIAATIFLPLGFITGLLGINVGGMPGVESEIAFWGVVATCLLIVVGQTIFFKYKRWF